MSTWLTRFGAVGLCFVVASARADDLDDVKARLKIEAQRLKADFDAGRAAAFKIVRADGSRLREATNQLNGLLSMVRNDTALDRDTRQLYVNTLVADLTRVRDIADSKRMTALPPVGDRRPATTTSDPGKARVDDFAGMLAKRSEIVKGGALERLERGERRVASLSSVEKSATAETLTESFPADWKERTAKRSVVKMTDMEKTIMKSLQTPIAVEIDGQSFQDALDHLRKLTGLPITADKRALEEAGVTYETPIKLKMKSTPRTILKKMLGELNLAYVIKDETVQITTRERASQMTVVKTYYLGDLAGVVGVNLDPITSRLLMLEKVNGLTLMITQQMDPKSWRVNNPEASGEVVFDPITMTLIVKQTAEFHFLMGR